MFSLHQVISLNIPTFITFDSLYIKMLPANIKNDNSSPDICLLSSCICQKLPKTTIKKRRK